MIYPDNYENKIGFDEVRTLLRERCLSSLGCEKVDELAFSADSDVVGEWLGEVHELRHLMETDNDFPLDNFFDMRQAVARIRLAGTHFDEQELFDLRRSLDTIARIVAFLC